VIPASAGNGRDHSHETREDRKALKATAVFGDRRANLVWGGIQVYDDNYQYIGALVGMESFGKPVMRLYVFVPNLKKFTLIVDGKLWLGGIQYEGEYCTEVSYLNRNSDYLSAIKFDDGYKFFTGGALLKEDYTSWGALILVRMVFAVTATRTVGAAETGTKW